MEQQLLTEAITNSQGIIIVPDSKINNNANTSLNTSLPIIDEQHQNIPGIVQPQSQSYKRQQIQCQKQQISQYKTLIPSPSPLSPLQLNKLICKNNYQNNNISNQNQSQQKQSIDSIAIMPKMPQNAVQQKNDKNLKDNSNHSNNKNNNMTKNNAKMCQIIVKNIQQQQILPIHTLPDIQKSKSSQHIHHQTHHSNFRSLNNNNNNNIKNNSNNNSNSNSNSNNNKSLMNDINQQQQLKLYIDCPVNQQVQQNKRLFYKKTQQQKQYPYENSSNNNNLRKTLLNCKNNVKSTLNDFNFNVNIKENQIKNTNSNKWKKIERIINSLTKKANSNNNNSNKSINNDKNTKTTTDNFMKCTVTTATHNTNKKPLKNSKNNEQQTLFHDDEDSIQYIDGYTPGPNHYNPSRNTTSAIRQQTGSSSSSSCTFSQAERFSKIRPITALAQYSTPLTPIPSSYNSSYNSKPSTACTLDTVSFGRNKSNPRSEIKKIQYCDWIRPHFYQENIGNSIQNIMRKSVKNGGKLNGSSCFKSVKERFQNIMPGYNGPDYYIKPNLNNNNENNINDNQLPLHYFLSNVPKGLQFQTNKYDQQNRTFQSYNNGNKQKSNKKSIKFSKSTLKSFSISKKQKQLQMQRQSQEILPLQQQISPETPKNSLGSKRKYFNKKTKDQFTAKSHKNKQNRNKNPNKNSDQLQYKPKAKFQQYRQSINNQNQNQTESNNFEQEYALLQKINQAAKNRRTQVTNMWITPSFNVKFQSKQTLFRI